MLLRIIFYDNLEFEVMFSLIKQTLLRDRYITKCIIFNTLKIDKIFLNEAILTLTIFRNASSSTNCSETCRN